MPSSGSDRTVGDRRRSTFDTWNRKIHYYLGLFFLFFLWLFSLTGLLLNHGSWRIAEAANKRAETRYERTIAPPAGNSDLARAKDVLRQLGLAGEVDLPATQQPPGHFDFQVASPKDASQIKVDLTALRASVQHFDNSGWAVFRIFHTFSGSRFNTPDSHRDWILTSVWTFAMDVLSAGLILMVLGSYYMWFRFKRKSLTMGILTLAAGYACCALFLRFMFS
jgi:hypothetical protein